jgi:hypothetical protein
MNSVAADELPVMLLEIDHADLQSTVRVTNMAGAPGETFTHSGNQYDKVGFNLVPLDDLSQGSPRAQLSLDNTDPVLMELLETTNGGVGAKIKIISVLPSAPNTVQWEVDNLSMMGVSASSASVDAGLGFEDLLGRAGVAWRHTPNRSPGIY